MELALIRSYFPGGTNGTIYYRNSLLCYTIELPWRNNTPQRSCIHEGSYGIQMRYSKKHGIHMMLKGVKDRSLILIHPANDAEKELRGCIAPVTRITGQGKGILSRMAFEKVKEAVFCHIDEEPVFITIKSTKDEHHTKGLSAHPSVLSKGA